MIMLSSLLAEQDAPTVIRSGHPMHVQISLSIPSGIGTLMSEIPYRNMSFRQSMFVTLRGVCISCSLGILYRTRI